MMLWCILFLPGFEPRFLICSFLRLSKSIVFVFVVLFAFFSLPLLAFHLNHQLLDHKHPYLPTSSKISPKIASGHMGIPSLCLPDVRSHFRGPQAKAKALGVFLVALLQGERCRTSGYTFNHKRLEKKTEQWNSFCNLGSSSNSSTNPRN